MKMLICLLLVGSSSFAQNVILKKGATIEILPIQLESGYNSSGYVYYTNRSDGRPGDSSGFLTSGCLISFTTQMVNKLITNDKAKITQWGYGSPDIKVTQAITLKNSADVLESDSGDVSFTFVENPDVDHKWAYVRVSCSLALLGSDSIRLNNVIYNLGSDFKITP